MRILILGGTQFLGRHIVEACLKEGHEVLLFNRGQSAPELFSSEPRVTCLIGDRKTNLEELKKLDDHSIDRVIDCSGNFPSDVKKSCEVLCTKTDHYIYLSSVSVYEDFSQELINEESATHSTDGDVESNLPENYGARKRACEKVVLKEFGKKRSSIIRPGLIVGPYDQTWRFFYWLERFSRGGDILIPNALDRPVQFIYVRDLANWLLTIECYPESPVVNAVGLADSLSFSQLWKSLEKYHRLGAHLKLVDEEKLQEEGVSYWTELPLWVPEEIAGIHRVDLTLAKKLGLKHSSLEEIHSDSWEWLKENLDIYSENGGLEANKEREIIAKWSV